MICNTLKLGSAIIGFALIMGCNFLGIGGGGDTTPIADGRGRANLSERRHETRQRHNGFILCEGRSAFCDHTGGGHRRGSDRHNHVDHGKGFSEANPVGTGRK